MTPRSDVEALEIARELVEKGRGYGTWENRLAVAVLRLSERVEELERERDEYRDQWADVSSQAFLHYWFAIGRSCTAGTAIKELLAERDRLREALDDLRSDDELIAEFPHVAHRIDRALAPDTAPFPTLDDRNPASVVGVPWNEDGYAGAAPPDTAPSDFQQCKDCAWDICWQAKKCRLAAPPDTAPMECRRTDLDPHLPHHWRRLADGTYGDYDDEGALVWCPGVAPDTAEGRDG